MTTLEYITEITQNAYGSTKVLTQHQLEEILPNIIHKIQNHPQEDISSVDLNKDNHYYGAIWFRTVYDSIIRDYVRVYLNKNHPTFWGIPLYYSPEQKIRLGIPVE